MPLPRRRCDRQLDRFVHEAHSPDVQQVLDRGAHVGDREPAAQSAHELVRLHIVVAEVVEDSHRRVVEAEDGGRRHQVHVGRAVRLERVVLPSAQQIH